MANAYNNEQVANSRESENKAKPFPKKDFNLTANMGEYVQVPHEFKTALPIKVQDPK